MRQPPGGEEDLGRAPPPPLGCKGEASGKPNNERTNIKPTDNCSGRKKKKRKKKKTAYENEYTSRSADYGIQPACVTSCGFRAQKQRKWTTGTLSPSAAATAVGLNTRTFTMTRRRVGFVQEYLDSFFFFSLTARFFGYSEERAVSSSWSFICIFCSPSLLALTLRFTTHSSSPDWGNR